MSRIIKETVSAVQYIIGVTDPYLTVRIFGDNGKELLCIDSAISYSKYKNEPCLQAEIDLITVKKNELLIQVDYSEEE